MSSQYVDSILLEANRLKSIEYISGNTSETKSSFTNKFAPVHIDAGDNISLFSGYVSAVGAGGEVIEVTGKDLNEEVSLYETEVEKVGIINPSDVNYTSLYLPYNASQVNFNLKEKKFKLKDNNIPLEFRFYKNTNGELHIHLPRKFDKQQGEGENDTTYNENWTNNDSSAMGKCVIPADYKRCSNDWMEIKFKDTTLKTNIKRTSKNERYTIMVAKNVVYSYDSASFTEDWFDSEVNFGKWWRYIDPALHPTLKYDYYQKIINLEVDVGFDSPSNIAESLTNQLKKSKNPEAILGQVGSGNEIKQYDISTKLESELYRTFRSATPISFDSANYTQFFSASAKEFDDDNIFSASEKAVQYISNYNFIGMKRPEIYVNGRIISEFNNTDSISLFKEILRNSGDTLIVTDFNYTLSNTRKLRDFFSSQKLYPELFEYPFNDKVNINNSRYIHFNASNNTDTDGDVYVDRIGNDNYTGTTDKSSIPVFIDFDSESEFVYNPPTEKLEVSFGCCVPYYTGTNYQVAFETKKNGGLRTELFSSSKVGPSSVLVIPEDWMIGYDLHFNAYGNDSILLYNGYLNRYIDSQGNFYLDDWNGQAQPINEYATEIYCGTRDPLINFDSTTSRYGISRLHTSEQVGNFYMSGSGQLPVADDASDEVYKMNKRLNQFSYTPDMIPYDTKQEEGGFSFFKANLNLDRTRIYDSHSGVYINKIGISETNWNKSLMGILGFSYNQFFKQENSIKYYEKNIEYNNISSNLLRLNNINLNGLTTPTTNNNVTSEDSIDYCVNVFNSVIYSPQMPLPQIYAGYSGQGPDPSLFPTIVQKSDSTFIKADNLPLKQDSPYYIIRTSVLGKATMDSNRNLYPVIATIDKTTPSNDYFSNVTSSEFTFTQPMTITEIRTDITRPDGSFAFCDDRSSVIYKVQKNVSTDFNIGEEILQQEQKK
ncbi:MAG: hypothetical protein HWN79_17230 [Candidatus Lokiarchaeota archaeon]|nr:hypothetical protein [Candidatus Lokiarchaeota archaeon]